MAAEESRTEGRRGCSFCSTWKAPFPATATPERRTASEPSRNPPDPPETCTQCTFPHLTSALAELVAQPLPRRRKTFFFFSLPLFLFLARLLSLFDLLCVRVSVGVYSIPWYNCALDLERNLESSVFFFFLVNLFW